MDIEYSEALHNAFLKVGNGRQMYAFDDLVGAADKEGHFRYKDAMIVDLGEDAWFVGYGFYEGSGGHGLVSEIVALPVIISEGTWNIEATAEVLAKEGAFVHTLMTSHRTGFAISDDLNNNLRGKLISFVRDNMEVDYEASPAFGDVSITPLKAREGVSGEKLSFSLSVACLLALNALSVRHS